MWLQWRTKQDKNMCKYNKSLASSSQWIVTRAVMYTSTIKKITCWCHVKLAKGTTMSALTQTHTHMHTHGRAPFTSSHTFYGILHGWPTIWPLVLLQCFKDNMVWFSYETVDLCQIVKAFFLRIPTNAGRFSNK